MKVSRREAQRSPSIVISVRPTAAAVHTPLTLVQQAVSHIDAIGGDIDQGTGEVVSRTTSPTPPLIGPRVKAPPAVAGEAVVAEALGEIAMSVMGVDDAATARTRHARLNARATAATAPRREMRATWTAMGVDTRKQ